MSGTIFALATSASRSALHIHRLTGMDVFPHILKCLSFKGKDNWGSHWHGKAVYTKVFTTQGDFVDDGIATFFFGPQTFTGEDTFELTCHGNPLISKKLQECWRSCGCTEAKPGEFTLRSFLNGKCDLTQAEAIGEIIHAKTHKGLELAQKANSKDLQAFIDNLKEQLTHALSYLEAHIDFAPDEVGDYDADFALTSINDVHNALSQLEKSYSWATHIRSGLPIVICGLPNAGKSTLFNGLLGFERAIVTDNAGTTRDTLNESVSVGGRDFVLVDTAGIRMALDEAEQLGIGRSQEALKSAQAAVAVLDSTQFFRCHKREDFLFDHLRTIGFETSDILWLLVFTKTDLLTCDQLKVLKESTRGISENKKIFEIIYSNYTSFDGVKESLVKLYDTTLLGQPPPQCPVLMSHRQQQLVHQALTFIEEARGCVKARGFPESVASSLISACHTLEEIIGGYSVEPIYNKIFSSFCIGK